MTSPNLFLVSFSQLNAAKNTFRTVYILPSSILNPFYVETENMETRGYDWSGSMFIVVCVGGRLTINAVVCSVLGLVGSRVL